tara:strand:+ start:538 stop:1005 length:468 start_codon:yes stop_codon:yes gene_type:complete
MHLKDVSMKKISKHISYKEATNSNYAKEHKIENKPNDEQLENMQLIAEKVFEPLREWVGGPIKVNSFFRSEELNSGIKGSLKSSHLKGQAIDLTSMGGKTNLEMFNYIKDNLDFDQLIWEYGRHNPVWLHVSYKSEKNRKQVLIIKEVGQYKLYN